MKPVSFESYVGKKKDDEERELRLYNSAKCDYQKCNIMINNNETKLNALIEKNENIHDKLFFRFRYFNLFLLFISSLVTLYKVSLINSYDQSFIRSEILDTLFRNAIVWIIISVVIALIAGYGYILKIEVNEIEKDIDETEKMISIDQKQMEDILTSNYYKTIRCPKCNKSMKIDVRELGLCDNCGYLYAKYQ